MPKVTVHFAKKYQEETGGPQEREFDNVAGVHTAAGSPLVTLLNKNDEPIFMVRLDYIASVSLPENAQPPSGIVGVGLAMPGSVPVR